MSHSRPTHASHDNGFALILSLIIAGVVLSIGLSLLNITVKQLTLSSTARESEVAFQVANAALECLSVGRYNLFNSSDEVITYYPDSPPAVYEDSLLPCLGNDFDFTDANDVADSGGIRFTNTGDWEIAAGDLRCYDTDLYVFPNGATIDVRSVNKQCEGSTCFVGVARGYNRSCEEVRGGAVFAVEREITAEF